MKFGSFEKSIFTTEAKKPVCYNIIHLWFSYFNMSFCMVALASPHSSGGPKRPMDKKLRRQIANSNERRRMQSINQGFHQLRLLMPHLQGEKLSKVNGQLLIVRELNSCGHKLA